MMRHRWQLSCVLAALLMASPIQADDAEIFLMSYPNANITVDGDASDWNLDQFGTIVAGGIAADGDPFEWEPLTGTGDIAAIGWDDAGENVYYGAIWQNSQAPDDREDNSVRFYARDNETHQYFLVDIIEDEINTDDDAAWANDCVEFYFDPANDRSEFKGGDPPWETVVQLVIDAENRVQVWNSPIDYEEQVEAGIDSAVTITDNGWMLEVGIDKSVFETPLPAVLGPANDPAGNNYGIELSYRDNDDPDDTGTRNGDTAFTTDYVWADPNPGGFPNKIPFYWGQMIAGEAADPTLRLDDGSLTDPTERANYVHDVLGTWIGDSNLDGEFNSTDFVVVFQAGEYEDGAVGNSVWATGDWNGDKEFNSTDFVAAFVDGGFELGARPAVAVVPEPVAGTLFFTALALMLPLIRRNHK
ncbi:MAG: hypothetical protein CMJ77_01880 [Planctomycetaceae bacterium]|nr:hypothetical protein [Planctomycetaceae bacterium]